MMKTMSKQTGVSFGGFIMGLVVFVVLAIMSMKLIPAYIENGKVQKALDAIVRDPAIQTAAEIKEAFSKRANTMDDVTVVNPNDLEIVRKGNGFTVSVSYSKKVKFAGNVSLLIEFNPSASN